MKKLQLSTDLCLPVDAITQTFLVVGKRGSGKSNTAARLVEQFHQARLPFVVLDPVDTWWGLKASADGAGPGLGVYVFGGRKADLPLEAGGGALIAEVLCEHRISMVLSVKHLSGKERSAFMVAFAQTLFQKWQGGPLHVVLEEAHELAPQMASGGRAGNQDGEAAMLGAFKRLWKLGRASGIGGTAVTQRPASLSKDITTQSEILIAHRTIGPQDVKAIGEWVKYHGQHEQILGELPSLPTGQAFIWAPEFPADKAIGLERINVRLRETYDSASTPKVGEQRVEPKQLADVDIERLKTKMASTIERAKADDPRELKRQLAEKAKRISELERNLAHGANAVSSPAKVVEKPALTDAERKLIEKLTGQIAEIQRVLATNVAFDLEDVTKQFAALIAQFKTDVATEHNDARAAFLALLEKASVQKLLEKLNGLVVAPPASPNYSESITRTPQPTRGQQVSGGAEVARRTPPAVPPSGDVKVSGPQQRILNVLAWAHQVLVAPLDKTHCALLADASPSSSTFANNLGALRSAGLIDYPQPGRVALTDAGDALASLEDVPVTDEGLQQQIFSKVSGPQTAILRELIAAYPEPIEKATLAQIVNVSATSSTYANNLGSLRSLGLIDYPRQGFVVAKPVLFLEGR